MNSCNLKPLPLGTSDFAALRNEGQIYVDKTALVYEIASKRQKFFLSRPRRFGKSLLISTFESLFKYGLRDFKGLASEIRFFRTKKLFKHRTVSSCSGSILYRFDAKKSI